MSNQKNIDVRVTANTAGVEQGMDKAAKSVEDGAQRMDGSLKNASDSMGGVASLIQSRLAMLAGAVAAAFSVVRMKQAADSTADLTEAAMDLGRAMGISASEASIWISVLDDVGASQGELEAASRGLTMKLLANEDSLNRVGLATRDVNGKLRPMNDLMHDGIAVVNSYREGTDRNAAAQEIFGRSVRGSSKLLLATKESAAAVEDRMRELGIVVGQDNVQAWKDYDDASDNANLTNKAISITIGNAMIPVMTEFKRVLVSIGPELVKVARIAMETFLGVIDLARMVKQAFVSVGSDIGAVAAAAAMALKGDFTGAMNVFKARAADAVVETKKLKELWNGTGDSFLGKFREKFKPSAGPGDSGRDFSGGDDKSGGAKKGGKGSKSDGPTDVFGNGSFISSDKGAVEAIKQQFDAVNDLQRDMVKDAEKAANDAAEADKKAYTSRTNVALLWANNAAAAQLSVVDTAEAASRQQYDLGVISYQQLLTQEAEYESQRHAVRLQALNERLAMLQSDPERNPETIAQAQIAIEELERQHQANMPAIKNGAELERNQYVLNATNAVQSSVASSLQKVMMGQVTLAQGLKSIWQGVTTSIAQMFAQMAAKNIATMLMQAAQGKAIRAKEIFADAKAAAAGAYKAIVGIPYVGPFLAPAAAAVAFGGVMAFASAEGGYDIPAGQNPLTQLHEKEMVLPAKHAEVIRGLADGKSGEGGESSTQPLNVYITSPDTRGVRDMLLNNPDVLAEAIRKAHRNGFR